MGVSTHKSTSNFSGKIRQTNRERFGKVPKGSSQAMILFYIIPVEIISHSAIRCFHTVQYRVQQQPGGESNKIRRKAKGAYIFKAPEPKAGVTLLRTRKASSTEAH